MRRPALKLVLFVSPLFFVTSCKDRLESSALADTRSPSKPLEFHHQQAASCTGDMQGTTIEVDLFVDPKGMEGLKENEKRSVNGMLVYGPQLQKFATAFTVLVRRPDDTGLLTFEGKAQTSDGATAFTIQTSQQIPGTMPGELSVLDTTIELDCKRARVIF